MAFMHLPFRLDLTQQSLTGMTVTLLLAVILSGLIGLERELHGHPAGLRTHILVCVGSTLITLVSVQMALAGNVKSDPGRISAQIVSGIGFLGAGAIIRDGASIRGLTTAASIWTTAAIGIALGAGPFYSLLACLTTGIVLFTLWGLNVVERWLEGKGKLTAIVQLRLRTSDTALPAALAGLVAAKLTIQSILHERGQDATVDGYALYVRIPIGFDRTAFLAHLSQQAEVLQVSIE